MGSADPWTGNAIDEGDILTVSGALFRLPNEPAAGAAEPGVLIDAVDLGIIASTGGYRELDALSYGRDDGTAFVFSVDEWGRGSWTDSAFERGLWLHGTNRADPRFLLATIRGAAPRGGSCTLPGCSACPETR